MNKPDCIFCKIAQKEIPAIIVFENDRILAFEDVKPQAPAHILIIPKHHIERTSDLTESNIQLIGELVLAAKSLADQKGIQRSGYRIVLNCGDDAGQEIFHLHLHLLGGRKFSWPPG
ncbi:MAG: histidine triad nucleotide-binding protein [Candidatus Omnitrophica bacterium]|nr:histidine triad nucleotide-binding protein [Candidatus Omnitrophota bacterium]MBU0881112.1 histidine triad nucleotide-binding protein [Candidatus Omnitrophota bacterium]MBU0895630.1 histidine triad nucleotide-binding protein [Candidatus Omnitrophota bacterium]MBU1038137.1 histidine triad nucleotide-binding protein [Candidatus Omnitrophota bacterium]MBU1808452.1 histidine triad nucleotide-binding protein [Candidatus Omnitrophota bacterium]